MLLNEEDLIAQSEGIFNVDYIFPVRVLTKDENLDVVLERVPHAIELDGFVVEYFGMPNFLGPLVLHLVEGTDLAQFLLTPFDHAVTIRLFGGAPFQ